MPHLPFPPADNDDESTANKVVEYQRAACNKEDPARLARFVEAEQARLMVASKPWTGVPMGANPTSPFFEPIKLADDKIKLANRNEIAPIIDSEVARLIGSTSEPSIIPSKPTTVVHRAAKKGEQILDDILLRCNWTEKSHIDARNTVQYGTSWILSGWENDYKDMKSGPGELLACDAMDENGEKCGWNMLAEGGEDLPGGGTRFTGPVAKEMVDAQVGVSISQPNDKHFSSTVHECPSCGAPLTKRRALPMDGEMDAFGYSTSEETPLPKVFIEAYPDTDVFPIGGGRTIHGYMPEVTIETIAPVDWLMDRYEAAGEVKGQSLGELEEMGRWHPAGLEMWGYAGHTLATDQKRWATYRITIRQPFEHQTEDSKDEPLGRLMISANQTVLFNGPLMFEYRTAEGEKKLLPRMRLFPFANEAQNNSVHGISTTSRLVAPQQALDAMLTQLLYDMATMGSPDLLVPKGANLEGQGDGIETDDGDETSSGTPHRIIRFDAEAGEPIVIEGHVTHAAWKEITTGLVEHMQRTTMQSQLDQGKAASGAPSASAQMYIGQRLDETRKPKGQRWANRLSDLFSYDLECVVAVYTDKRQFKAVDALDNRTVRDFSGADLMGQTNVKVETKPAHDTESFQRQNLLEILQLNLNLVDLSTPRQRLLVAKTLGIPDEMDAEPNQQIKQAQDEFLDATLGDPQVWPVALKRLDNHVIHGQIHMEDLRSPAGESMWRMRSMHELATDGWYDSFKALMLADRRMKTTPVQPPETLLTDPTSSTPGAVDTEAILRQKALYVQEQKVKAQIEDLPKNTQDRIEKIQMTMLEAYSGFQQADPDDQNDARALTKWLAHKDTHDWYALEAQLDAAPPAPSTQEGGDGQGNQKPGAPAAQSMAA